MDKMGVLFVSSTSEMGGAEFTLLELATHLDRQLFTPYLLVWKDGELPRQFREAGIQTFMGDFPFFSKKRPWVYWRAIWNVVSIVRRNHIDLIQVNCDRAVPHSVLAAKLARVGCVCYIHDMLRAWYLPSYVRHLNRSDTIVADSCATAEKCRCAGMNPSKLRVIYECFEIERYSSTTAADRAKFRREFDLDDATIAIGLVGQILRWKGHEDFVRAASIVIPQFPNVRFFVVGDDVLAADKEFLPHLRRLAEELNLAGHFVFTGSRSDIPQVMAGLDIVAVPSWEEPFGRVVVEALAARCPVVATRAGGIPEIVEEGVTGFLFPPKDHAALAEHLIRLCREPGLRVAMGARGPAAVVRFDVRENVRQFQALYAEVLGEGKSLAATDRMISERTAVSS